MRKNSCLPHAHQAPEPAFRVRDLSAEMIAASPLPGSDGPLPSLAAEQATFGSMEWILDYELPPEEQNARAIAIAKHAEAARAVLASKARIVLVDVEEADAEETEDRARRIRTLCTSIEGFDLEIGEVIAFMRSLQRAADDSAVRPLQEFVEKLEAENDYIEAHRG